jgi:hypothetical protein
MSNEIGTELFGETVPTDTPLARVGAAIARGIEFVNGEPRMYAV